MSAGAPWSVKGIDPKAREVAKELARRSGMTLGEWLTRMILEDDVPEEVASEADLAARPLRAEPFGRSRGSAGPEPDDAGHVAQALNRLTDRIEASETRTGLAIAGVEHSVREAVARIDAAEREQLAVTARIEGLGARPEAPDRDGPAGPRSMEALRALYGEEVDIPGGSGGAGDEEIVGLLGERVAAAEARTTESLEALRASLQALDGRLQAVEGGSAPGLDRRLATLGEELGRRIEAARADAAAGVALPSGGGIEQRLARMEAQVAAVETRSARAIDRMGREVLALGDAMNRRLQAAESQSAAAADQVAGELARIGGALDARFARAELAQAEALQRLGDEISHGAERLAARVGESERRAAQAIEDLGEQVARITERMEHRHERIADDFAERLRQSEARTARLLDEARQSLAARRAEAEARFAGAQPEAPAGHPFGPALFARAEAAPLDLEPDPPPVPAAAFEDEDDFAPIPDVEDRTFPNDAEPGLEEGEERQTLSTREVIEQARIAARAAGAATLAAPDRRPGVRGARRVFRALDFRSRLRPASTWQTALMVAGGAAFLSVGAAGVVLMEGPRQEPQAAALSPDAPAPRAAVALAPEALGERAPAPSPAPPSEAAYAAAVRDLAGGTAGALGRLKGLAEAGYAPAQFYLAKLYETGEYGVTRSPAEARRWTEAAAQGGESSAMHNLALYYFRGEAGPRDLAQAAAWFRRAAEAGVADSQYNLGLLYEAGSGVARDPAEAYKWFSIAANGGDDQARANAAALSARLSPSALAAAESQVQAFHPRSAIAAQLGRDPALAAAQQVLARLGYYDGPRDGTLSARLKLALSAYQHDHGLAVTGALDPPTASKLAVLAR